MGEKTAVSAKLCTWLYNAWNVMIKINVNVPLTEHKAKVQLQQNGIVLSESKAVGPELSSQRYHWLH